MGCHGVVVNQIQLLEQNQIYLNQIFKKNAAKYANIHETIEALAFTSLTRHNPSFNYCIRYKLGPTLNKAQRSLKRVFSLHI